MRFLIVESESEAERAQRRASAGKSAGESFAATLHDMVPGCQTQLIEPADPATPPASPRDIARCDAVFLSGSPMHVYDDAPEIRRQLAFMRVVFASGTPSFGSCAGLQIAVAAAGGTVRRINGSRQAGITRNIIRAAGPPDHPLLEGRPSVWEAATIHADEVVTLPPDSRLLAVDAGGRVQAAEIRYEGGTFLGVQYHPELSPGEIGAALRRSAKTLRKDGLARDDADVAAQADLFDRLERSPDDCAARWRLGVGAEYALKSHRRRELANFLAMIDQSRSGG